MHQRCFLRIGFSLSAAYNPPPKYPRNRWTVNNPSHVKTTNTWSFVKAAGVTSENFQTLRGQGDYRVDFFNIEWRE